MEILDKVGDVVVLDSTSIDENLDRVRDADAVLLRICSISGKAIDAMPNLKVIAKNGVGVDAIDVEAATRRGIPVVVAAGANTRSVAEHAIALMFTLAKQIPRSDAMLRKGNYDVRDENRSFELYGKTLGLIGFGNIGRETARLAMALGLKILAYDPIVPKADIERFGASYAESVERVCAESDIVSIHVPLIPQTRDLIAARQLAMMKPHAILINCSRGGIVNEDDLRAALSARTIGGAGLDVFVREPIPASDPLTSTEDTVLTPHLAALTRDANDRVATMVATGIADILSGKRFEAVANPKVYEHEVWKGR